MFILTIHAHTVGSVANIMTVHKIRSTFFQDSFSLVVKYLKWSEVNG